MSNAKTELFQDKIMSVASVTPAISARNGSERMVDSVKMLLARSSSWHSEKTSIVIPVHNALEELRICLNSLWQSDAAACPLYIVNDGSDTETTAYLRSINSGVHLLEHDTAIGYTVSINEALCLTESPYVVVANSDLEFPRHWLQRLLVCLNHAEDVGVVGPLSNAASYQSVPFVHDRWNGFKINDLPERMSVDDFNEFIYRNSKHLYPEVPIANGFCMLMKKEVLEITNYFDAVNFPRGYGEEDDFCWRASRLGYKIHCADDVYVYHAKSRSFGIEKRKELIVAAKKAIDGKYPDGSFAKYAHSSNFHTDCIRENIIQALIRYYISNATH